MMALTECLNAYSGILLFHLALLARGNNVSQQCVKGFPGRNETLHFLAFIFV